MKKNYYIRNGYLTHQLPKIQCFEEDSQEDPRSEIIVPMDRQDSPHITEGIVLRALDYGERDRIVTLLSAETGLMSLYLLSVHSKRRGLAGLAMPGVQAEWVLESKRGEFWRCSEASLINSFPLIRRSLEGLRTANFLLQHVLDTQLPGTEVPLLYQLLRHYLEGLNANLSTEQYHALKASFVLKTLKHDGLLDSGHSWLADEKNLQKILEKGCSQEELKTVLNFGKRMSEV